MKKVNLKKIGTCVEDNLLGIYSPIIKSFTLETIRNIASEFYRFKNIFWNFEMGYSSDVILKICERFNISMYAYDIMNTCFLKHVVEHSKKIIQLYFFML